MSLAWDGECDLIEMILLKPGEHHIGTDSKRIEKRQNSLGNNEW